jgi:hypothetical protein
MSMSMYLYVDITSLHATLCTPNTSARFIQSSSRLPLLAIGRKCETSRHVFGLLDPEMMRCLSLGQEVRELLQTSQVWDLHDDLHIVSVSDQLFDRNSTLRIFLRSSRYAAVSARSRVSCKTAAVACATCAMSGPMPQLCLNVSVACIH